MKFKILIPAMILLVLAMPVLATENTQVLNWFGNNQAGGSNYWGVVLEMNTSRYIKSVGWALYTLPNNNVSIYDSTGTIIASTIASGWQSNFSDVILNSSQTYYISYLGSERTYAGATFPVTSSAYYSITACLGGPNWDSTRTDYGWSVTNITTEEFIPPVISYTEINLTIDSLDQNKSVYDTDYVSLEANINVTGLPITLMINGSIVDNDFTTVSYNDYFEPGLYNITSNWTGNDTYPGSTSTLWLTSGFKPVANFSYNLCHDNNTLYRHATAWPNGTFNYTDEYVYCAYGCDNLTASCSPEPFIQDLTTFGVFLLFIAVCVIAYKVLK